MEFFTFISEQWVLVSVLMVLVYAFAMMERTKSGKPVTTRELTQLLNSDQAVLVDIRDSKDFKAGHVVGAIHFPVSRLKTNMSELDRHKEKIVIIADKVGQHAGSAGRMLQQNGFNVRRLGGGMMEWQNQNLPVVKGS